MVVTSYYLKNVSLCRYFCQWYSLFIFIFFPLISFVNLKKTIDCFVVLKKAEKKHVDALFEHPYLIFEDVLFDEILAN